MPMSKRAGQFQPFAALSGYGEAVKETERLTDKRIILDEQEIDELNAKLQYLYMSRNNGPEVTITCFIKDPKKEGGSYEDITGTVKNIDTLHNTVIMSDGTTLAINDITGIELPNH